MTTVRKGYVKSEQQDVGRRKDTYTPESGTREVARVMAKAEASHAKGPTGTERKPFMLEPNSAKHTTADDYEAARFPR